MSRERWNKTLARQLGKDNLTSDEANIAFIVRKHAAEAKMIGLTLDVCPYNEGPHSKLMQEAWYQAVGALTAPLSSKQAQ